MRTWLRIVGYEHKFCSWLVESALVPRAGKRLYGTLRHAGGVRLYRRNPRGGSPTNVIAGCLPSAGVYVDVGAHRGEMVGVAVGAVGSGGQVFAFEPNGSIYEFLLRKKLAFAWHNVQIERILVGNEDGGAVFYENLAYPSSSSIYADWSGGRRCFCPMTRLDSWISGQNLDHIDLIKIDTEGAENEVLRGARRLLADLLPLLILEIGNPIFREGRAACGLSETFMMLRDCGYDRFIALQSDAATEISCEADLTGRDHDLVAASSRKQNSAALLKHF